METRRFYSQTKGRKEMLLYSILDTISVRRFQFASHASAVAKMFNCISCDWPSLKGLSKRTGFLPFCIAHLPIRPIDEVMAPRFQKVLELV